MNNYKPGDSFALEDLNSTDDECTAKTNSNGFDAFCVLNPGHEGQHVAPNAELVVVAVWN